MTHRDHPCAIFMPLLGKIVPWTSCWGLLRQYETNTFHKLVKIIRIEKCVELPRKSAFCRCTEEAFLFSAATPQSPVSLVLPSYSDIGCLILYDCRLSVRAQVITCRKHYFKLSRQSPAFPQTFSSRFPIRTSYFNFFNLWGNKNPVNIFCLQDF